MKAPKPLSAAKTGRIRAFLIDDPFRTSSLESYDPSCTNYQLTSEEMTDFFSEMDTQLKKSHIKLYSHLLLVNKLIFSLLTVGSFISIPILIPTALGDRLHSRAVQVFISLLIGVCLVAYCGFGIDELIKKWIRTKRQRIIEGFLVKNSWSYKERGFKWNLDDSLNLLQLWTDVPLPVKILTGTQKDVPKRTSNLRIRGEPVPQTVLYVPENLTIIRAPSHSFQRVFISNTPVKDPPIEISSRVCSFPWSSRSKKYMTDLYNPLMTGNSIGMEEIVQFLGKADICVLKSQAMLKNCLYIIIGVLCGCTAAAWTTVPIATLWVVANHKNGDSFDSVVMPCFWVALGLLLCTFGVYELCIKRMLKWKKRKIMQDFLKNSTWPYRKFGFRWVIPDSYPESVELWVDEPFRITTTSSQQDVESEILDKENNKELTVMNQSSVLYAPDNLCIVRVDPEYYMRQIPESITNLKDI